MRIALVIICTLLSQRSFAADFYVAPTPTGQGSGLSLSDAASLQHGLEMASRAAGEKRLLISDGIYKLDKPIVIYNHNGPFSIISGRRAGEAVLDGGNKVARALEIHGSDVAVSGLTIQNFVQDGVLFSFIKGISITGNYFYNISSSAWSEGAIHGLENVQDANITGNIIVNTGYSGIIIDGPPSGRIENVVLDNNNVTKSCLVKRDCGAIYVTGRTSVSSGIIVSNNVISDFGPSKNATKGIYLDDLTSNAIVRDNKISGSGSFGIQIHGGSNNLIIRNEFSQDGDFLLYQTLESTHQAMVGNYICGNKISNQAIKVVGSDLPTDWLKCNFHEKK